jgi:hypothetical protein
VTRRQALVSVPQRSVSEALVFIVTPQIVLPIERAGGRHVHNVRSQGRHNQIFLPLQVHVTDA